MERSKSVLQYEADRLLQAREAAWKMKGTGMEDVMNYELKRRAVAVLCQLMPHGSRGTLRECVEGYPDFPGWDKDASWADCPVLVDPRIPLGYGFDHQAQSPYWMFAFIGPTHAARSIAELDDTLEAVQMRSLLHPLEGIFLAHEYPTLIRAFGGLLTEIPDRDPCAVQIMRKQSGALNVFRHQRDDRIREVHTPMKACPAFSKKKDAVKILAMP